MKAFKLASGFAVSALTLAIAGTAAAQTTANVSYSGSVKVQTVIDLENETRNVSRVDNNDWWHLNARWNIVNGPFSGSIRVGQHEDNPIRIDLIDLKVVEGPISFGQVGRVTDSAGVYENITAEVDGNVGAGNITISQYDKDENTRFGVDQAIRYTESSLGLKVQLESAGAASTNFGVGVGINNQVTDGVVVKADFQYREAPVGGVNDGETAFGASVEATFGSTVVKAAYRNKSDLTDGLETAAGRSAFAVHANVGVTDDISVYAIVVDAELEADDTLIVKAGASMGIDAITVEGSYETFAHAVGDGVVKAKVSWAEGAIGAYGEVDYNLALDDDALGLKVGGSFTTESTIKYGADWELLNKGNVLTAYAQYKF